MIKLEDDSGIGKTFFCDSLRAVLNTWEVIGDYPVKNKKTNENIDVLLMNGIESMDKSDLRMENTLFIIDEADILLTNYPDMIDSILSNKTSYFLFMLRADIPGMIFDYYEKAYITHDVSKKLVQMHYYT